MCWDAPTDQRKVRPSDLAGGPTIHTAEVCGEREITSDSIIPGASISHRTHKCVKGPCGRMCDDHGSLMLDFVALIIPAPPLYYIKSV